MSDFTNKNPKNPPDRRQKWSAIFPTIGQQTALMLAWPLLICGMIFWIVTGRGSQLIDIDQAEFRETRFLIDVNSAGTAEFSCLPGIGKKTAKAIVDYRDKNGPFSTVESLVDVPGVSQRLLNNVRDFLHRPALQELAEDNRGIP